MNSFVHTAAVYISWSVRGTSYTVIRHLQQQVGNLSWGESWIEI